MLLNPLDDIQDAGYSPELNNQSRAGLNLSESRSDGFINFPLGSQPVMTTGGSAATAPEQNAGPTLRGAAAPDIEIERISDELYDKRERQNNRPN